MRRSPARRTGGRPLEASALNPFGFVRALWDGFVVLGLLHTVGESTLEGCLNRDPVYDAPPPGHPEQLRPDLPLTALEQRLRHELRRSP
ncbi:hypothetical protein E6P78_11465 [Streptomyces sp. A0958]|uniref:DUF6059 family protein n=1 Tax=Streptomyces sp. A0958 TaxID=2563101 RepID=UPI00109E487E|nr:DUF6059 family protein [Streptomyces sp. A0958]THA70033.1 hypothetical protein E6P78_11465 [Streptomyces sp. A0958]